MDGERLARDLLGHAHPPDKLGVGNEKSLLLNGYRCRGFSIANATGSHALEVKRGLGKPLWR
jgi:hypothetical protein